MDFSDDSSESESDISIFRLFVVFPVVGFGFVIGVPSDSDPEKASLDSFVFNFPFFVKGVFGHSRSF